MIEKNSADLDVDDLMNRINQVVDNHKKEFYAISTIEGKDCTLSAIERYTEESMAAANEAEVATTVKSKLPKFFNRLLRKQNVVNRKLIKGLRDVTQVAWQCTHLLYARLNDHQARIERLENRETLNLQLISKLQSLVLDQEKKISELSRTDSANLIKSDIEESQVNPSSSNSSSLDSFYLQFENRFRGTRGEIAERQKFYIPILEDIPRSKSDSYILDIGCGRGEWIAMLNDREFQTLGLDTNDSMIQECQTIGLNVKNQDAIDFLKTAPENSIMGITGFHIIEHIEFQQLIELFHLAHKALMPGGLIIFETPNPENLQVGTCSFHLDYTHTKPYPPTLIEFLGNYTGFSESKIEKLHPYPVEHQLEGNDLNTEKLNNLIFGPQDYAIIARK